MTLSDSIENYKYIEVEDRWSNTKSKQLEFVKVSYVKKDGYYTSPSNINSNILISTYDNYYAYLSFKSSTTLVIPAELGEYIHIVGVYGVN